MFSSEEERQTHPSFGQILFSRCSGNAASFYGSELPQDYYISMEVQQSEVVRTLTNEWHFAKGMPIIRLRMTANQFSEMITHMNHGSGVPCTIEYINGDKIDPLPHQESRKEFVHRKFEDRMSDFASGLKEGQEKARTLLKKKTLSKQDQHELNHLINWMSNELTSNIPFFAKCFQETMDEVVLEAKSEVENAIQHKMNTLGLSELHKQNNLLTNATTTTTP